MNCKPGDLAIMVGSFANNNGKLYRVLGWIGHARIAGSANGSVNDCWRVECLGHSVGTQGKSYRPGDIGFASDAQLRPIRDPGDDAKDEMLRPLPNEVTA